MLTKSLPLEGKVAAKPTDEVIRRIGDKKL